jgi:hypothetical protein
MKHTHYVIIFMIFWTGNLFSQSRDSIQECANSASLGKVINMLSINLAVPDDWTNEKIVKVIFKKQCDWTVELILGVPHMRDLELEVIVKNKVTNECHLRGVYVQQGQYVIGQGFSGPVFMYFTRIEVSPCLCPTYKPANKNPNDYDFWEMAMERDEESDYAGVIAIMDNAISVHPKFAPHYYLRAEAKYKLGDYKEAIIDYSKTIQLNPQHATAYKGRADSKYKLKDYSEALKDLNKTIELQDGNADDYFARGLTKYAMSVYDGAIQDFDESIYLNPSFNAYFYRALAKYKTNDKKGACLDYKQSMNYKHGLNVGYDRKDSTELINICK